LSIGSPQSGIELFSTCPPSYGYDREEYLEHVERVAQWSDDAGYRGTLIYTDNRLVDPWLVAQLVLQWTCELCPLVAVQPLYMHPYAGAKMVATLAFLHGRRIYLNLLAGGFKNDLVALGDDTPHDERYERTVEYAQVVRALLTTPGGASFAGRYYTLAGATMGPPLPEELLPGVLISGSSEAGLAAARAIGATAIRYPGPPSEVDERELDVPAGIRVGVIARDTEAEAWAVAHERFPADRKGQIAHALAMRTSDSQWHGQLSSLAEQPSTGAYWLHPFKNYRTFCPYLVGSFEQVGEELARYYELGFTTFIFDVPPSREEFDFIERALSPVTDRFVAA
jgi:alkanesulfonate monooxygenase